MDRAVVVGSCIGDKPADLGGCFGKRDQCEWCCFGCAALAHGFRLDGLWGSDFFSPPAEDFFLDLFGSASVGNVPATY